MPARVGCASGGGCGVGGCLQGRTPVLAVDPCSVPVLSSTAPAAPSFVLFNGSQRKDEQRVFLYWGRGWAFSPVIHICLVCLHQTRPILVSVGWTPPIILGIRRPWSELISRSGSPPARLAQGCTCRQVLASELRTWTSAGTDGEGIPLFSAAGRPQHPGIPSWHLLMCHSGVD